MRRTVLLRIMLAVTVVLFPATVFGHKMPDNAQKGKILKQAYSMQVPFIENMGQVKNKEVRFYADTFGGTIFVEKTGCLTYSLPAKGNKGVVIKEVLTDETLDIAGRKLSPTRVSYFKGKAKDSWQTDIPTYTGLTLGEIHNGIELTLKAYGNNVEKLFTVLPEKDPKIIRVKVRGAERLKVNKKGELEVITGQGPVKFTKPAAYQSIGSERKPVEVSYVVHEGNTYGFKVGNYNKKRPLIIDPLLASTFIGGGSLNYKHDYNFSIAIDNDENVYVTGHTVSNDYPTTAGAYDEDENGGWDVFVSKFDSTLSTLLASTYIGGDSGEQRCYAISVDDGGNVYVTGYTNTSDYPTTPGAYDGSHNGNYDVFVSRFDSDLSTLLASTFIGGADWDHSYAIAVDGENVFVTGYTESSDYPATPGAYDDSHNGGTDGFVSNLDSTLSTLSGSTFVGGGDADMCNSVGISEGAVYITGRTQSGNFPTTSGAYNTMHNEHPSFFYYDAFVSKFDTTLGTLLASTFIGGSSGNDTARSIAINGNGDVYITGDTDSFYYPTTPSAYDESGGDMFISKLDAVLETLLASTFIGGGGSESRAVAIGGSGDIYITGYTQNTDYPITSGAYDESHNGGYDDVFVSKLDSGLSTLLASTFIGGGGRDWSRSIAVNGSGDVYVAGDTLSPDYPTTLGAYDESHNGETDVFVSKLDANLLDVADFTAVPTSGYASLAVQFTDQSTGPITNWYWDFGDGGTSSEQNPLHTYSEMGDYTVSLLVSGPDIGPDTETKTEYIHVTGVEIDHVLPDTGLCREVMTVNGSGFGGAQDVIDGDVGDYKVVQVVGASGTYTAAAYCCWSDSQFRFLFGDMFSDEDQDFIRDATEPYYRQCEDFSIGQYAVYVKNIHYQDVDNSNTYSQGDLIEEVTAGGPVDFVLDSGLAVYVIDPGQVERSHYCPSGELVTSVVRIYGWGFGDTQGDSKVYIGTGGMWSSDTGLELGRTIWSDLMIKAAVDVPLGAKGMTLYIWVEKDGVKTDDKYGSPGVYILPTETCP